MKFEFFGTEYDLSFRKGTYLDNNALAIQVMCKEKGNEYEEPFGMLTVNLPNSAPMDDDCAYVDVNGPAIGDIIRLLEEEDVATYLGITSCSGYVTYPQFNFSQKWLDSLPRIRI